MGYTIDEINTIFNVVKPNNLRKVHIFRENLKEARSISITRNVPKSNALFAILARDNNAIMVSRDKHFTKLKGLVKTKKPEELI